MEPTRRAWAKAVPLALATVYVPTATPFFVGPLIECDHCVASYLTLLPIVPGVILLPLSGGVDALAWLLPGLGTLLLLALALGSGRCLRWSGVLATAVLLMPLIALECVALSYVLRA